MLLVLLSTVHVVLLAVYCAGARGALLSGTCLKLIHIIMLRSIRQVPPIIFKSQDQYLYIDLGIAFSFEARYALTDSPDNLRIIRGAKMFNSPHHDSRLQHLASNS
jgi:hypothetical protein